MKKELLEKFKKNVVNQTYLKTITGGYGNGECGSACYSTSGCREIYPCGGGMLLSCSNQICYAAYQ